MSFGSGDGGPFAIANLALKGFLGERAGDGPRAAAVARTLVALGLNGGRADALLPAKLAAQGVDMAALLKRICARQAPSKYIKTWRTYLTTTTSRCSGLRRGFP